MNELKFIEKQKKEIHGSAQIKEKLRFNWFVKSKETEREKENKKNRFRNAHDLNDKMELLRWNFENIMIKYNGCDSVKEKSFKKKSFTHFTLYSYREFFPSTLLILITMMNWNSSYSEETISNEHLQVYQIERATKKTSDDENGGNFFSPSFNPKKK